MEFPKTDTLDTATITTACNAPFVARAPTPPAAALKSYSPHFLIQGAVREGDEDAILT